MTVTAFDSGGAPTTKTFTLTVTTPVTCTPVAFAAANYLRLSAGFITSVAVGDFNGDGKQDLAVSCYTSAERVYLVGQWRGQFRRPHQLRRWRLSWFSGSGRFQRRRQARPRGYQPATLTCRSCWAMARAVSAPPANFGAGGYGPSSVAVGDFNGDGKQDLAVANFDSNNVSILLGNGVGSFSAATNFGVGS